MSQSTWKDLPFPAVLRIEPAASCNFRCIHCPTGLGLAPAGIMSAETFAAVYEKIKKYYFRVIVLFHGGEPLLNKNFGLMVQQVRPLAGMIKINTNGSLLDEKHIEMLLGCGIDKIMVSLDGVSPEENNEIRVGSDFHKIITSIKKLLDLKAERRLYKPEIHLHNNQIAGRRNPGGIKLPQYIIDALGEYYGQVKWDDVSWAYIWPGLPLKTPDIKPDRNFCDSVINTLTIRWNGDVVPCCNDLTSKMIMGNALGEDLETIWNNEKYKKLRADIHDFNPPDLCRNCYVLYPSKLMTRKDFERLRLL